MVTHGEVFLSSFSAGKHSGLSPKYEILRLACHCERAEHRPSAGTLQALFQLAQSFFDESQHIEAMERRAVAERGPCKNHLQRTAGAFQLRFCQDFGWLAHSGKCPALCRSCGDTGRTAREQVRHFFVRLSGTPVAPWAAYPHGVRCMGPLMPVTTCAFSPARNRSQFGVFIGRARCRASHALARRKRFIFNLTRGGVAFIGA